MSLQELDTQLDDIRARASATQKRMGDEITATRNDDNLSDEGKRAAAAEIRARYKTELDGHRASEDGLVEAKIRSLETRLDAQVGTTSTDLIAFRDAQDRAERLDTADDATRMMARAIRTHDRTLAHAIFRRAAENNWTAPARQFRDAYPDAAEVAADLAYLEKWKNDNWFAKTIAYGTSGLI